MPHGRSHAADEPLVGGALREMLDLVVQGDMRQCQLELVGGEEAAWAVICSSAFSLFTSRTSRRSIEINLSSTEDKRRFIRGTLN